MHLYCQTGQAYKKRMQKKIIGIIGGMGPMATVELFRQIVENTDAKCDSEHIHIIIDNYPQIPDRTDAILNRGPSPVPYFVEAAIRLKKSGCDFVIIPCNTSHFYLEEISNKAEIEVFSMIHQTALEVVKRGIHSIGLLATTGTINAHIYEKEFERVGVDTIVPSALMQKSVMSFIYDRIKAGVVSSLDALEDCINELKKNGANSIVLGCTELSVATRFKSQIDLPCFDALHILAIQSIVKAGYRVKKEEMQ